MKQHKHLHLAIRLVIVAAAYGFIWWKLSQVGDQWREADIDAIVPGIRLLPVVLALMPLNWILEAFRWRELTGSIQTMGFSRALRSVMAGITVGIFTPRRIGDVGGRCLFMDPGGRRKGAMAFALSSVLQTGVTTFFGLAAIGMLFITPTQLPHQKVVLLLILALAFMAVLLLGLFHLVALKNLLLGIPFLKRHSHVLAYFDTIPPHKRIKTFLLGMARYVIFSTQFYLLIRILGVPVSPLHGYTGIALLYLLMSFVPLSSLAGLGIRGSTSVFIFSLFTPHTAGVALATLVLWTINLALPSLAGAWIISAAPLNLTNPLALLRSKSYKSFLKF